MTSNLLTDAERVGDVAAWLRLVGDATRIRILGLLMTGERNVSALCEALDLAQPTVSHHLGLLRNAEIVHTRREGKQVHYALNDEMVERVAGGLCLEHLGVSVHFRDL